MKRLFWMGVGGALAVTAARRTRKKLDPVLTAAAPVTGFLGSVRALRTEFRAAMATHEAELRAAFIEEISSSERPAPDPRLAANKPSWARRTDVEDLPGEDDDELIYSF